MKFQLSSKGIWRDEAKLLGRTLELRFARDVNNRLSRVLKLHKMPAWTKRIAKLRLKFPKTISVFAGLLLSKRVEACLGRGGKIFSARFQLFLVMPVIKVSHSNSRNFPSIWLPLQGISLWSSKAANHLENFDENSLYLVKFYRH